MTTIQFLENQLAEQENAIRFFAVNFKSITNKMVKKGKNRDEAERFVEWCKRTAIGQRDTIRMLIAEAHKTEGVE